MAIYTTHSGDIESVDGNTYTVELRRDLSSDPGTPESIKVRSAILNEGVMGGDELPALITAQLDIEIVTTKTGVASLKSASGAAEGESFLVLQREGSDIWTGFLLPDFYRRPIGPTGFALSLSGKLGLNRLDDIPFDPIGDGVASGVDARMTYADGFAYCLSQLHEVDMYLASDLYASDVDGTSMSSGDPLEQAEFQVKRFYDDENPPDAAADDWPGEPASCRDVLLALCGTEDGSGALRHVYFRENAWHVVDYDLLEQASYTRRRYDITGGEATLAASGSHAPTTHDLSEDEDWVANPTETFLQPHGSVTVEYKHGEVPNLLFNGDFQRWTSNEPDGWTSINGADANRRQGKDGVSYGLSLDSYTGSPYNFTTIPRYRTSLSRRPRVQSGQEYELRADVYIEAAEANTRLAQRGAPLSVVHLYLDVYLSTGSTTYRVEDTYTSGTRRGWHRSETADLQWVELTTGSREHPIDFLPQVNMQAEYSVDLPAVPEEGDIYIDVYAPARTRRGSNFVTYNEVRFDLINEGGTRQESRRVTVVQA